MPRWERCLRHGWLFVSVIVTADSDPWCIGDGDELNGHWAEVAA